MRYILTACLAFLLSSCYFTITQFEITRDAKPSVVYPVRITSVRQDIILTLNIKTDAPGWSYTAEAADNGRKAVVEITGAKMNLVETDAVRPVSKIETEELENGIRFSIFLGNKNSIVHEKSSDSVRLIFRALEPDMEVTAMELFGSWITSSVAASQLIGIDNSEDFSVLKLNSEPAYGWGTSGNKFYVDIFGVRIPEGNLKQKDVASVISEAGKTRVVFNREPRVCPDGKNLIIGRQCRGYSTLYRTGRKVLNGNESFDYVLTGRPQIIERRQKGMTALGIKNAKVFGGGLVERFEDRLVYKVETRQKEGITWLVFLHEPEVRYKTYYSGDNFFVVFYKG